MEAALYPVLLPHFEVGPDGLYLGGVLVCELDHDEKIYCKLCDGQHSMEQILRGLPDVVPPEEVMPYMFHLPASITEQKAVKEKTERILVLSPNPESAFLAMGGSLSQMKDAEVRLLVCFKQQEQTHLPELFSTRTEISAVRNDEAHWAAQVCGVDLQGLNYPGFSVRRQKENFGPDNEKQIAAALKAAILTQIDDFQPDRIYAPAGIGEHPDHLMIHQLTLDLFKRSWFPDTRYLLYREYPYALNFSRIDEALARIEAAYVSVEEQFERLDESAVDQSTFMDLFFSLYDPTELSLLNHLQKRTKVEANTVLADRQPTVEAFFELRSFQ